MVRSRNAFSKHSLSPTRSLPLILFNAEYAKVYAKYAEKIIDISLVFNFEEVPVSRAWSIFDIPPPRFRLILQTL